MYAKFSYFVTIISTFDLPFGVCPHYRRPSKKTGDPALMIAQAKKDHIVSSKHSKHIPYFKYLCLQGI